MESLVSHDRIAREAELLNQLVAEILTLCRLEGEARSQRRPCEIDFYELVREVVRDADFEAQAGGQRVELAPGEPLRLMGFADPLRRAVDNVVRNALKFSPPGGAVRIELERIAREGRRFARLRVRDSGPGVPEAYLQRIFQPFFRVSESRARRTGGTGLGLAITARAIELHGGFVRARNAEGGGLIVSLALPIADEAAKVA